MIVKNGVIATASDTYKADILIEKGIITAIGKGFNTSGHDVVDADGKYVIPGGVDVHTHFDLDVGTTRTSDDFYTGSIAAACGGTTTIVDHMGFGPAGCRLRHQVDVYHKLAKDKCVIDYGFHGVIQHVDKSVLDDMQALIKEGITSYKVYLTYGYKQNDKSVFEVFKRIKELGLILTVHPENDDIIESLKSDFSDRNLTSPIYHALSRPEECEAESINKMVLMASIIGDAPLYIVHLSSHQALSFVNKAKKNGQKNLYVETCPQYLMLNDSLYDLPDNEGLKYIISPPLRNKINNDLLWESIINCEIDTVATDHCSFNFNTQKMMGKDDFRKCPNGGPGVETRMAILYSEGVAKGRISINKYVDLCCTKPAKLFGLYPKKGGIGVGFDGDLVLIDPFKKYTLTKSLLHENIDYTPYEGLEINGAPILTISRGEIIAKDNQYCGADGRGLYIKRGKPILN